MNQEDDDIGIMMVVIHRFETQSLPRMIEIKQKLDQGGLLNDTDIEFLDRTVHNAKLLFPYLERHPEYEPLFAKVMHYYKTITDMALANEK